MVTVTERWVVAVVVTVPAGALLPPCLKLVVAAEDTGGATDESVALADFLVDDRERRADIMITGGCRWCRCEGWMVRERRVRGKKVENLNEGWYVDVRGRGQH